MASSTPCARTMRAASGTRAIGDGLRTCAYLPLGSSSERFRSSAEASDIAGIEFAALAALLENCSARDQHIGAGGNGLFRRRAVDPAVHFQHHVAAAFL